MITPRERELLDRVVERDENLKIHRSELEMQGEELKETQEVLMKILRASFELTGTDELLERLKSVR
jgi:hypothetical protein